VSLCLQLVDLARTVSVTQSASERVIESWCTGGGDNVITPLPGALVAVIEQLFSDQLGGFWCLLREWPRYSADALFALLGAAPLLKAAPFGAPCAALAAGVSPPFK
jgi:hypothetical protein